IITFEINCKSGMILFNEIIPSQERTTRMRNAIILVIGILFFLPHRSLFAQPKIQIIYPKNDDFVFSSDSIFIYGNVQPPTAELWINRISVKLFPNGSFLKMFPLDPENLLYHCQATTGKDTISQNLQVRIPDYLLTSPTEPLLFDTSFIFPKFPVILRAGDQLRVAFKGTPGGSALLDIEGLLSNFPLYEIPANRQRFWGSAIYGGVAPVKADGVEGVYTGVFLIDSTQRAENRVIRFRLSKSTDDTISLLAPGTITIDSTKLPMQAKLAAPIFRPDIQRHGNAMFLIPDGTPVPFTARYGNHVRFALSEIETIWSPVDSLEILSSVRPLPLVRLIGNWMRHEDRRSSFYFQLNRPTIVKIDAKKSPAALVLTFWDLQNIASPINVPKNHPLIGKTSWNKISDKVQEFRIELKNEQIWGYQLEYQRNNLVLEIKDPPELPKWPASPLRGLMITLDPGHNPDPGAVGPSGLMEKDVNLIVCERIKKILTQKGAFVLLTREDEYGIDLDTRPKLARFVDADVLISMHFNSLPDGVNPYKNSGTSTYYFQPHSYKLAQLIHNRLLQSLKLPDHGLYNRSYVLTKPTDVLAVLVEPAFIIHPSEEMLIRTPEFQEKIAQAIVDALEEFFNAARIP
ncbi:N-acetylmuramoyl-L-alanine amidase, partial [candidate division KSB1 bacterium]|nr:N-acetylmuramoyl-L-alanine amidase [candidate division KSB1 bacterium]